MLERVPVELRDEFITKHPHAKVLDYMEREDEVFDNKTIYWKDGNLLGVPPMAAPKPKPMVPKPPEVSS